MFSPGIEQYLLVLQETEDMDTCAVTCFSIYWLLIVGFVEVVTSLSIGCPLVETTCGSLHVRFPFRIIGRQPEECGYRGFALECPPSNHAVLELPRSVKLYVKSIDYTSQTIDLYDPSGCFSMHLRNLSLTSSPFQFLAHNLYDYTFFDCPSQIETGFSEDTCLNSSAYMSNDDEIRDHPLSFCTKMFTIPSVSRLFFNENNLRLKWSLGDYNGLSTKLVILTSGSLLLVQVIAAVYCIYRSCRSQKETQAIIGKFLKDYEALKPTRYSYAEIKRITNWFEEKLGEGAYGVVYKGKISNQFTVAVKILTNSLGNGEDFINEVGTMGRIHHVNIVRLIGYCAEGCRRVLVYELIPNGSLQKFINSPDKKESFLGWEKLQEIALGIAKGIEYLHQGCEQRILHFDIKPQNVLLDHHFTPKICDFGLAKLCSKDQSNVSMTTVRGTMGYIAPEVFSRNFGNISHKSDVYSFGMLLLETIDGRQITKDTENNTSHVYYPEWIYNLLDDKEDIRIHIEDERDTKIAKKLGIVGLWCIQWHAVNRPSMQVVVQMLEGQGDKLAVPSNPFASAGRTRKSANVPATHPTQALETIHELD